MITLHFNDTILKIYEDDSSYRHRALGEKTTLTLKFSLPEFVEIPVGAWCEYQGETFTLNKAENFKKNNTRDLEYTLILGDPSELLGEYKLRNPIDRRLKWSMCATPQEFVQAIVDNLNQRAGGGWSVGDCIEAPEKTIEFNHVYCDAALSTVANDFKTEFEIIGKQISLHKVEYFKNDPLPLGYGKGNGFKPGVGRSTQSDQKPIRRLYVQGGDRNIDRSKYGSAELLLPKDQTLDYDGKIYQTDNDGYYIERITPESTARKEDSLDLSEIYPSRVGVVSSVVVVDASKNWYDFIDDTIPQNLNFNDYIIAGETPVIIFQSGMLSGNDRQFEFKYDHETRRFELKPQEIDGVTMPNNTFKPVVGDKYAIFGIMLPDEYICNNPNQSGASWDMFREAVRYLSENEDTKFTFTGELQSLFTKKNWLRIGGRLKVGSYILFTDEQFAKDGVLIRIVGIKDYTTSPYAPIITISNEARGVDVNSKLNEIGQNEIKIDESHEDAIRYTKRRFRDATETMQMLEQSLLDNFTNSINPIAVHTMQMLVGDESLQFRFVTSKTNLTAVPYNITYNNTTKKLTCPHGYLQHMTLDINTLASSHKAGEYLIWEMSQYESEKLTDSSENYYLYARVHRTDTDQNGSFLLSHTPIGMRHEANYYHLLVGVLNTEYNGERSFVTLYGFSEILPGRILTDRIVSSDGLNYFDLANNEFNLGGLFSLEQNKGLWLRSKMILGDTDSNGKNIVWSGHNGLYKNGKTIASFWGGPMVDRFYDENGDPRPTLLETGFATSLVRMDGSAYWANGNIRWNESGAVTFGTGIKLDLGDGNDNTLGGLCNTVANMFEILNGLTTHLVPVIKKTDGTKVATTWDVINTGTPLYAVKSIKGLYTDEFLSAKGLNDSGEGTGEGGGGGLAFGRLDSWDAYDAERGDALSAVLGYGMRSDIDALSAAQTLLYGKFSLISSNVSLLDDRLNLLSASLDDYLPLTGGTMANSNVVTNLNADLLDGKHNGELAALTLRPSAYSSSSFNINNVSPAEITYYKEISNQTANIPDSNGWANGLLNIPLMNANGYEHVAQLYFPNQKNIWFRTGIPNGTWEDWKKIAFTTDNVASATKLATPRSIFGVSGFDGTADLPKWSQPTFRSLKLLGHNNETEVGFIGCASQYFYDLYIRTYGTANVRIGSGSSDDLYISNAHQIGVKTIYPAYDLDVNGTARFRNTLAVTGAASFSSDIEVLGGVNIHDLLWLGDNLSIDGSAIIQGALEVYGDITLRGVQTLLGNTHVNQIFFLPGTPDVGEKAPYISGYSQKMNFAFHQDGTWYSTPLTLTPGGAMELNGVFHATTGIYSDGYLSGRGQQEDSDERLKEITGDLNLNLRDIATAPCVVFRWRDTGKADFGSIAQHFERINPLFASTSPKGTLTIDYGKLALIYASENARRTLALEERIEKLESLVNL